MMSTSRATRWQRYTTDDTSLISDNMAAHDERLIGLQTEETIATSHHRPMLTVVQQFERLKIKGATFTLCDEALAADTLATKNNYLRITSYRKLYERKKEGPNVGNYINLDFGDLVAISSLDRQLREAFLF